MCVCMCMCVLACECIHEHVVSLCVYVQWGTACVCICVHVCVVSVCVYGYVRFGPCNSADSFSSGTFIDADFGTKSGSRGTEFKGKIL